MTSLSSLARKQKLALWVVIFSSFLAPFMSSAINLAIPSIGRHMNGSVASLGWIPMAYLLTTAAFTLPFGRMADKVGKRPLFLVGTLFFGIVSIGTAFATTVNILVFLRGVNGVFAAMILATGTAILVDKVAPEKRGMYMGYISATVYTGLSMGPVVGGFMNQHLGWQSIFIIPGVLSILIFLGARFLDKEVKPQKVPVTEKNSGLEVVLYILIISAFLYGVSSLNNGKVGMIFMVSAFIPGVIFVLLEKKRINPLIPVNLFTSNRIFLFSNLATLVQYISTIGIGYVLSLYLQWVLGMDSSIAGLVLIAQPIMMVLFSPFAGTLSDKYQPRILASLGIGISSLGLLIMGIFAFNYHIYTLIITLILIGIGSAFFSSPNTNSVMGSVSKTQTGHASSTLATMRSMGQGFSMAIMTLIISYFTAGYPMNNLPPETIMSSMRVGSLVFLAASITGLFLSMARGDKK